MILSSREREERAQARAAEYRAGDISEAHFAAYLFTMKFRGEDIRQRLRDADPPKPYDHEAARLARSRQYVKERTGQ